MRDQDYVIWAFTWQTARVVIHTAFALVFCHILDSQGSNMTLQLYISSPLALEYQKPPISDGRGIPEIPEENENEGQEGGQEFESAGPQCGACNFALEQLRRDAELQALGLPTSPDFLNAVADTSSSFYAREKICFQSNHLFIAFWFLIFVFLYLFLCFWFIFLFSLFFGGFVVYISIDIHTTCFELSHTNFNTHVNTCIVSANRKMNK